MGSVAISKRIAVLTAELESVLAESFDGSAAQRAAVAYEWETFLRRTSAVNHEIVRSLGEVPTEELGERSLAAALSTLLRISTAEANRRIKEAADLRPRAAMTAEPLQPVLTNTAAAQRRGPIGAEHVQIIREFFKRLPGFVDHDTRHAAETQLAQLACGLPPEELRAAASQLATLLDQDGDLSDADRARRSHISLGRQQPDGMSPIRGQADPELRGLLDAVFAKWAAPGLCNPDDENPCLDGEPTPQARSRDLRSTGQRQHDALTALCRAVLASGQLGSHNGLPVTMGHLHHPARVAIGCRPCRHRRRHAAADVGSDPPSRRRPPLPVRVRQPHRRASAALRLGTKRLVEWTDWIDDSDRVAVGGARQWRWQRSGRQQPGCPSVFVLKERAWSRRHKHPHICWEWSPSLLVWRRWPSVQTG